MQTIKIILLLFSVCNFLLAFKYLKDNKIRHSIFTIVLGGLILRVIISLDVELHEWDERYHALVAKNLINHPLKPTLYDTPVLNYDYKDWMTNHIWLHKQPLPLWAIAISLKFFGNSAFNVRIPSILISTFCIFLIFMIGKKLINEKTGILSAFLFAVNGLIIELVGGRVATDHIDTFFLGFFLMAIYLILHYSNKLILKTNLLIGFFVGLSMLCKWLPGMFVIPIFLFANYQIFKKTPKKYFTSVAIILTTSLIIFLPWQIFTYINYSTEMKYEIFYNFIHFTKEVESHSGPWYYYMDKIRINYGEFIYVPILWFGVYYYKRNLNTYKILLFWILIPLLFFSIAKTKMQGYIIIIAPALFILTSIFYFHLNSIFYSKFRFLRIIFQIAIIILPIRYCFERLKPFSNENNRFVEKLIIMNKSITNDNSVLFNCNNPIEAMFYTKIKAAYKFYPSDKIIDSLYKCNYQIFINETDKSNFDTYQKIIPVKLN